MSNSGVPTPAADSLPNAAYVDDPSARSDKILTMCSFTYNSASTQLTFRNNYALEPSGTSSAFDCGLVEFSADNGVTWNDIILAGGSFVEGGYNRTTISSGFQNACFQQYGVNKASWSGSSGGFITTRINLPASGIGQPAQLRWRMCSDTSVSSQGWRVDNVAISDGMICPPLPVSAVSRMTHGGAGTFDIDLSLNGTPGIECRSGGPNGDYQLIVTFANSVTVDGASVPSGTATVGSVTASGPAVTINLVGVANAQTVWISLNNVNDGTGSGCAAIPLRVLVGDTNANGSVNSADVSQAKSRIDENVNASNFRIDVNANGAINAGDVSLIKSNIGTGLP
jgi:hypothetical protein